ncbi:hypothetical protein GCM10009740_23410 [Terrabacter terrae]|uniref:Uncharacterized protein n=1 Tax=Terrabacter terrae TaxID=318434 RepID=A0ABN2UAU6_9MICO
MDRGDLRTRAFEESATAAESRAAECRRRVSDLQAAGAVMGGPALALARDRLARARARAAAAERRLAEAVRNHEALTMLRQAGSSVEPVRPALPGLLGDAAPTTQAGAQALAWLRSGAIDPADLWWDFVSLGGRADFVEFDAYLNGAWTMSERDRTVLEHVCWEYDSFGGPGQP